MCNVLWVGLTAVQLPGNNSDQAVYTCVSITKQSQTFVTNEEDVFGRVSK